MVVIATVLATEPYKNGYSQLIRIAQPPGCLEGTQNIKVLHIPPSIPQRQTRNSQETVGLQTSLSQKFSQNHADRP